MKEIKAFVRPEDVSEILTALKAAGAMRIHTSHAHAVGSGVDDTEYRVSSEEGTAYTEQSKIEVLCDDDSVDHLIDVLIGKAATGRHGDGILVVTEVDRLVSVRTGREDELALL